MFPILSKLGSSSVDITVISLEYGNAPATNSFPLETQAGTVQKPQSVGILVASFLTFNTEELRSQYHMLFWPRKYSKARAPETRQSYGSSGNSFSHSTARIAM